MGKENVLQSNFSFHLNQAHTIFFLPSFPFTLCWVCISFPVLGIFCHELYVPDQPSSKCLMVHNLKILQSIYRTRMLESEWDGILWQSVPRSVMKINQKYLSSHLLTDKPYRFQFNLLQGGVAMCTLQAFN